MKFSNTYVGLNDVFYEKSRPTPVRNPQLFLWNTKLAEQLMISSNLAQDAATLANVFSGNHILPGSEPIAMVYAGHQFGHFAPQLGDGRAHLLGEVICQSGQRWDIQLKGSGPTSFSRNGDGRCALGPAVREFIMSEAMNALGIATTRCLSVVTTGETVYRNIQLPGAIVTRVASSHVRVGTFQFFAARNDLQSLKTLCDYTIARHFPEVLETGPNRYIALIDKVIDRQIKLVIDWTRVGFIHGVMNTDNTSISGDTIDYGPCAMMGVYDPHSVYSSIDVDGRYAFGNQPEIAHWNMLRFAECLLPLIDSDEDKAVNKVVPLFSAFPNRFEEAFRVMMATKLGLTSVKSEDQKLISSLLTRLKESKMDYTVSFHILSKSLTAKTSASQMHDKLGDWFDHWQSRLNDQGATYEEVQQLMRQYNPVVIPRNHHVEAVIQECEETGEASSVESLLHILRSPYQELPETASYQDPPSDGDEDYQTFCGT